MLLKDKKVVIMGVRNKWSIAWGAAKSAYEQGAKVICTCSEGSLEKVKELVKELPGTSVYVCDNVSKDSDIDKCLEEIKKDYNKVDGILHAIAHANTEDLRNDFINTSRDGYAHAQDVSAYSLIAIVRMAREKEMLNEGASIVAYTYYGAEKVVEGYNLMGIAKASLEASIKYLAKDLGKDGYRINGISAGPIKTLSAKGIKDFGTILNIVEERAPLHKNVTIEQVGDSTTFLFSKLSSGITGEIIHVDNGFSIVGV
ncbi:MAG: enoyl-ACP reductase [Clostridia bacterium]|nr:enoyl-ACP reductase [Clostridium sp.]MBS6251906.1 enoyl-ACP reductase [Clostridium sp.]